MEPDVEAAVTALAEDESLPSAAPAAPAATIPLREPQLQNAVAFLSHPKVRSSSTASKRSFLEGKGLTAAEIDEGFRRVPEAPASPAESSAYTASPGHAARTPQKPFATATTDALQAVTSVPQNAQQRLVQPEPIRWTQVVAGAGAVAAGIWVVHHFLMPPALRWWRGSSGPSADEKAAAAIAAAIQAQTAEMRHTMEGVKDLLAELKEQKAASGGQVSLTELRNELRNLALTLNSGRPTPSSSSNDLRQDIVELKALVTASANARASHHPPFAADGPSFARADPMANGHAYGNGYAHEAVTPRRASPSPSASPSQPSAPASYMEVLEMLERGETPPGIRSDIVDTPPDPHQPASESRLKPRAKPWERVQQAQQQGPGASSSAASSVDGDGRGVRITEIEPDERTAEVWKPPAVPQRSILSQQPLPANTVNDTAQSI